MGMGFGRFQGLDETDPGHQRPGSPADALFGTVQQAEVQGIHPDFFANLVEGRFQGKGGRRGAGGAVSGGLGPVDHHIIALDVGVGDVVGRHHTLGAAGHRGTGESAGLENQGSGGRRNAPLFGSPDFHLDDGAGSGAGGLEHFGAVHCHLDRRAGFAGQQGGQRLHIDGQLGPEPAADFHRDGFDFGHRNSDQAGGVVPHHKLALAAGPNGQSAVLVPLGGAAVGFNVALMDRYRGRFLFHDHIGFLKALVNIPQFELEMVGNVGAVAGVVIVQDAAGPDGGGSHSGQALVEQGGVGLHRFPGVHYRRQDFVVHGNQLQGFLGGVGAGGGDGGDGVALIQGLVLGQHIVAEETVVDHRALGQFGGPARGFLKIGGGYYGPDAGMGGGPAGINGLDAGVGVGAAENLAVEQAGQADVRAVVGFAGDFVRPVGPHRPGAYYIVFLIGKDDVGLVVEHILLPPRELAETA